MDNKTYIVRLQFDWPIKQALCLLAELQRQICSFMRRCTINNHHDGHYLSIQENGIFFVGMASEVIQSSFPSIGLIAPYIPKFPLIAACTLGRTSEGVQAERITGSLYTGDDF